jgi:lycopene cyclase domain-containing protein
MKSLYLLVNLFTISIPFIFSFHPKIQFYKTWGAFFLASILVGAVFVIWDAVFTHIGVWNFNPDYLLGIYLFNLPVEEVLFFICIPFSCVFTYFCLDKFFNLAWNPRTEAIFCAVFAFLLIVVGTYFHDRIYTIITMYSTALVCLYLKFLARVDWFGKAAFVYAILLLPFFVVNGILTGSGIEEAVVRYNPVHHMGFRLLTIPVEDAFYGFELILLNLYFYKLIQARLFK